MKKVLMMILMLQMNLSYVQATTCSAPEPGDQDGLSDETESDVGCPAPGSVSASWNVGANRTKCHCPSICNNGTHWVNIPQAMPGPSGLAACHAYCNSLPVLDGEDYSGNADAYGANADFDMAYEKAHHEAYTKMHAACGLYHGCPTCIGKTTGYDIDYFPEGIDTEQPDWKSQVQEIKVTYEYVCKATNYHNPACDQINDPGDGSDVPGNGVDFP
jgi:hypothetical protein